MAKSRKRPGPELWSEGLMWVEAAEMQCARFERLVRENELAREDANRRRDCAERPWIRNLFDPPILVPTVALGWQQQAELSFLLVATQHVQTAEASLPKEHRPKTVLEEDRILFLLRDLSEHREDAEGRARRELLESEHAAMLQKIHEMLATRRGGERELEALRVKLEAYPPTLFELPMPDDEEVWLAGIALTRIRVWLIEARWCFRRALAEVDVVAPEPLASTVTDDDTYDWPSLRLRYRAWELEWQGEEELSEDEKRAQETMDEMDPVVDDLLAEYFDEQEAKRDGGREPGQ
ncbi:MULTISPECIES: hypothetical protein [Micrococcaceae]|uniref:hypothetical protein n=1 Tax=Micrococcaceae TaxID=1268 RepID=UPI001491D94C|nr:MULTISPECIES: hypothetical protein [Micrococcaceae]MCR1163289.1 hypothetical protein [Paenarthrobacter sp. UW852]NOJ63984.1 hypothetical protein [Arthrobacter sp. 147(2020)]